MPKMKRLGTVAVSAGLLLAGLWLIALKPDGPPPDYMLDLLAASPYENDAKQLVQEYFSANNSFAGVEKLRLPTRSAKAESLRSLEVRPDGKIVVKLSVRAKPSDAAASGGRVLVTLVWIPLDGTPSGKLVWSCTGTPPEYLPVSCRQVG